MKVVYDRETDTLTITLTKAPVAESDEEKVGVILDYDASGNSFKYAAGVRIVVPAMVTP